MFISSRKRKEKNQIKEQKKIDKKQKKSDKKIKKETEKTEKIKKKIESTFSDINPIKDYDNLNECFICKSGLTKYYFDILEVSCIDGENTQGTTTYVRELIAWQQLYETYRDDISIVALNSPTDVYSQLKYLKNKLQIETNPLKKNIQIEKINELEWLKKKGNERSYFIFIYGSSPTNIKEKINKIIGTFSLHHSVFIIKKEKKINILHNLNNPLQMIYRQ